MLELCSKVYPLVAKQGSILAVLWPCYSRVQVAEEELPGCNGCTKSMVL